MENKNLEARSVEWFSLQCGRDREGGGHLNSCSELF
jgi:hypothetical protein